MKSSSFAIASLFLATTAPVSAEPFSINDALKQATLTNPGVGEASANRRATESELRQTQSTLLPQVRLEARYGPEKFDQSAAVVSARRTPIPAPGAGAWRNGSQGSVVVRQVLFDGFASINDIWRQSARVNAAAFRVRERTELIALDAAEAYVDVVRYLRLIELGSKTLPTMRGSFRTSTPASRADGPAKAIWNRRGSGSKTRARRWRNFAGASTTAGPNTAR